MGIVLSVIFEQNYLAIVFIILVLVAYEFSTGPICYIHISEVASDVTLGLSLVVLNATIVILNLVTDPLMKIHVYGVPGVFFILGALSYTGSIFMFFFMRKTDGLNDIEKKTLYMPEKDREETMDRAANPEKYGDVGVKERTAAGGGKEVGSDDLDF
jgi:hypothetical protein